jgi:Mg2+/Co2+ transporter CorC
VDKRTLFERLVEFVSPGPDSKAELIRTLADAENRELIEPESRLMLEGVLRMADMTAGDVMVPATRMDQLSIESDYDELLGVVIQTGHSRFPVFDGGTRQHHRHPDGQGPAQAAAFARPEPAHPAAAGRVCARKQAAERVAA